MCKDHIKCLYRVAASEVNLRHWVYILVEQYSKSGSTAQSNDTLVVTFIILY